MIRRFLKNLLGFTVGLRRSGTTTLIKKVAEQNDVWVIVPNQEQKKLFGDYALSLHELDKMQGSKPKPILLDNSTIMRLTEMSIEEMENLDLAIKKRNKLIRTIRDEISNFERSNGKLSYKDEM